MSKRALFLAAAVLGLVLLNLWHWNTPAAKRERRPDAVAGVLRAEDFELRAGARTAEAGSSSRNIFQPRAAPAPKVVVKQVEAPPPAPSGPPPKTPQQVAEEAARDELRQIRLVGVVFREGKGQAFLVKGDQVYLVHTGGAVGERFRVEAIAPDGIQLSDPASRVQGQLPVMGK